MQKIDFDALVKNTEYFKKLIGRSKLCAVVKNDAYGHGLERVARYIAPIVDCFAVGSIDEAESIYFLEKDTLILIPQDLNNTLRAVKLKCILTVDSFDTLARVLTAVDELGETARIHIKIDSGMSRLGFTKKDISKVIKIIKNSRGVEVVGVYSHFWGDNFSDCDKQFEYFLDCVEKLQNGIHNRMIKHIANSSATILSSKYHLDMVRVGIGLYGYGDNNLRVVKTVTSDIVAIKRINAGEVVGYGGNYICCETTNIAVLNVGYANGLSRTLIGSKVLIGKKFCKIIAICMAMSMIEIGKEHASVGDKVTLIGDGVNISNDKVIIYELLCNLH